MVSVFVFRGKEGDNKLGTLHAELMKLGPKRWWLGPEGRASQQRGWHDQKPKGGFQEAGRGNDKWICCTRGYVEEPWETREGTENIKPEAIETPYRPKVCSKDFPVVMCETDLGRVWACKGYHSNLSRRGYSEVSVSRPCQLVYT